MKTTLLLALAAFSTFSLVACAADSGDNSGSSTADISANAPGAAEGQSCEGLAQIPCADGLVCDADSTIADKGGKCIKIVDGELGASCGTGISGITFDCKTGFHCSLDSKSHIADETGICVVSKPGEAGGTCGTGVTGITVDCAKGLKCKVVAAHGAGDQTGTCVE